MFLLVDGIKCEQKLTKCKKYRQLNKNELNQDYTKTINELGLILFK